MALEFVKRIFGGGKLPQPDPEDPDFYTYRRPSLPSLAAIPAAYAAIGLLASTLGQLPRTAARLEDPLDDYWSAVPDHPVSELLRNPSRLVDPWLFWEWMFRRLFAGGNAYTWVRREAGRPVELVPADCLRCEWQTGRRGPAAVYDLHLWGGSGTAGGGERVTARAADVVTLHGPGFDGVSSPSPIQYAARRTLELMDRAGQQQEMLMNLISVRSAIKSDAELVRLNLEQRKQLQEDIRKTYQDARRKGEIPVLPPGFDLTGDGLSSVDLKIIELFKWSVEDIARVYGVPPRLLGHYHEGLRITASVEAQAVDYERWSVQPHIRRVEEQLSAKLMGRDDVARGLVVRMPSDRIRAGSWSERVAAADQAVAKGGVMTPNEARKLLRLPPIEGGDKLLQPKGAPAQDSAAGESGEDDERDAA